MATTDVRRSVIGIVNEVQRKLGVSESASVPSTKNAILLVDFLNDTIDECNDYGNWKPLFRVLTVSAQSSVGVYEISTSAPIKNIDQVYIEGRTSPLNPVDFREIIRLQRTSAHGVPNHFAVVETSGINPKIWLHQIPGTNQDGDVITVTCFEKNRLYAATTADSSAIPAFPSRVLVQGVYAKAVLEESGQEETAQWKAAQDTYLRMLREAHNRLTADTGGDLQIVPG